MQMRRCESGHMWDPAKYVRCPNCGVKSIEVSPTLPQRDAAKARGWDDSLEVLSGGAGPTPAGAGPGAASKEAPPDVARTVRASDPHVSDQETVGVFKRNLGFDPVVGWLVCIEGPDRGRDFRIRSERNSIGRQPSMDICISSDPAVSRSNHAFVSFDPKKSAFKVLPGETRGLIYVDGEEVSSVVELKAGAVLEIGASKLLFVPLCGEKFSWTASE